MTDSGAAKLALNQAEFFCDLSLAIVCFSCFIQEISKGIPYLELPRILILFHGRNILDSAKHGKIENTFLFYQRDFLAWAIIDNVDDVFIDLS